MASRSTVRRLPRWLDRAGAAAWTAAQREQGPARGHKRAGPADLMGPREHQPVMVAEVLEWLAPQPGAVMVDATVGSGGHALRICQRLGPQGRLIGVDCDDAAIGRARGRLSGLPVTLVRENFRNLDAILDNLGMEAVDGVLFDLGMSLEQLTEAGRGFAFRLDGPLDARMDRRLSTTAADLLNRLPEAELARIFREYGQERWARRIARLAVRRRREGPLRTTAEFAALVAAAYPASARTPRIHPATRAFQALRIAVNDEVAALAEALKAAIHRTRNHGRVVVLSYHSLEERATKATFQWLARTCRCPPLQATCSCEGRPMARILTRRAIRPSAQEIAANAHARSARLRAAERIAADL
jgi:16S rRNA (cytosine1402-N4)-methyltransferase